MSKRKTRKTVKIDNLERKWKINPHKTYTSKDITEMKNAEKLSYADWYKIEYKIMRTCDTMSSYRPNKTHEENIPSPEVIMDTMYSISILDDEVKREELAELYKYWAIENPDPVRQEIIEKRVRKECERQLKRRHFHGFISDLI
jgi:hypothetical protein